MRREKGSLMNTQSGAWKRAAWLAVMGACVRLWAAEGESPAGPKPTREERPAAIRNVAPEERAAKIRESQDKQGASPSNRVEWEKRREEWRNLSPEARKARMAEWRERWSTNRPNYRNLSPEEREAKRQELRERLEQQLRELRQKKADGTLTPAEQRHLDRMEEISKRFEQGSQGTGPRPAPIGPPRSDQPEKPVTDK